MRKLILALIGAALSLGLSAAVPARAQGCGSGNPNCVVPTAPFGTSTNQAASTAFVQAALAGTTASSVTVAVTAISGGTANCVVYDLAGVLACMATANNAVLVTNGSGSPSISTTLPNGLAMGAPASLTLTNATGLPIAGLAGLGTGVGTWLATPSSANLRAALTDETGTGAAVFATGGTINPKSVNSIRYASQYGGADWCANLVLALADLGTTPGTIIVDAGQTINACTAGTLIDAGANHAIRIVGGSLYTLNQTIQLGMGSSLIGPSGAPYYGGFSLTATALRWTGATATPMVKVFNAMHSRIADLSFDCAAVADCIGLHYDSTNSPLTTQNTLENFAVTNAHYSILVGNSGTSHPTAASCNATPSQSGCYEIDFVYIRNFQIIGNCSDLTAEGIHINSYFAMQQAHIDIGNMQCVNIGIRNVFSAGANTLVSNVNGGGPIGASPVFIQTDSGGATGYNLDSNEDEGAWTYSLHDSGCSGSGTNRISVTGNGFASAVTLDGCQTVISSGNAGGGTWTIGGSARVISTNDQTFWTTAASGTVAYIGLIPTTVSGLPTCNAGSKGTRSTVTDANSTTFLAAAVGGGANNVPVVCDGTSWKIG